jgi:NAD(P)-dependent dehydrogenase (short-subunit alcohol dehydrogenase family)
MVGMARFSDKVAVVTGASKGTGAGIARRLAEGAEVAFLASDDASWIAGQSPRVAGGLGM